MVRVTFDPVFVQLGGIEIGWHGLFTVLAVVAGVWLGTRRARAKGIPAGPLGSIAGWAIAGGIVGARLFHVIDHLSYFSEHPLEVFAVWEGGIAVYGAFIGGVAAASLVAHKNNIPIWPLLDAAAPVMLVGQMIGRLGCLANGDAWGEPTGGDWGLIYMNTNALLPSELLGVPTHPYPLYEIGATCMLLGLLWAGKRFWRIPGDGFLAAAAGYGMIRFSLTFFRQEPVLFWGIQEAQAVGLATGLLAASVLILRRSRTSRRTLAKLKIA